MIFVIQGFSGLADWKDGRWEGCLSEAGLAGVKDFQDWKDGRVEDLSEPRFIALQLPFS